MRNLIPGRTYALLPDPRLQDTTDGIVTVVSVATLGGQTWVTVSGRVAVDGGTEVETWATRPERIGALAAAQRQADECLRRAKENTARARAAGTLRPVPYGIVRPLLCTKAGAR